MPSQQSGMVNRQSKSGPDTAQHRKNTHASRSLRAAQSQQHTLSAPRLTLRRPMWAHPTPARATSPRPPAWRPCRRPCWRGRARGAPASTSPPRRPGCGTGASRAASAARRAPRAARSRIPAGRAARRQARALRQAAYGRAPRRASCRAGWASAGEQPHIRTASQAAGHLAQTCTVMPGAAASRFSGQAVRQDPHPQRSRTAACVTRAETHSPGPGAQSQARGWLRQSSSHQAGAVESCACGETPHSTPFSTCSSGHTASAAAKKKPPGRSRARAWCSGLCSRCGWKPAPSSRRSASSCARPARVRTTSASPWRSFTRVSPASPSCGVAASPLSAEVGKLMVLTERAARHSAAKASCCARSALLPDTATLLAVRPRISRHSSAFDGMAATVLVI